MRRLDIYNLHSTITKEKRSPLYLFHEIADMLGVDALKLRSMVQVAARQKRDFPQFVMVAGQGHNHSISARRKYYRKADFIKFLKQEKDYETTT